MCAPDDEWRYYPKHVQQFSEINKLCNVGSDVNILGGSVHTLKKNAEALVAATKEIGLEVNAHKTK